MTQHIVSSSGCSTATQRGTSNQCAPLSRASRLHDRIVGRTILGGLLATFGLSLGGCSTSEPFLPIDDICSDTRRTEYIFRPVGNSPMGSFEPGVSLDQGALIIDDDDLSDDYGGWKTNSDYGWLAAVAAYDEWAFANAEVIEIANAIPEGTDAGDLTSEQLLAVEAVTEVYLEIASIHCASTELYTYAIGDQVAAPTFVDCKDRWYASGDGIVGYVDLTGTSVEEPEGAAPGSPQETARRTSNYFAMNDNDREMAACPAPETIFVTDQNGDIVVDANGNPLINDDPAALRPNTQALNFWAPLTTSVVTVPDASAGREGHTFSGVTIPLSVALYQRAYDASEWEGIGLWARLADADQAIPKDRMTPGGEEPLSGRAIPDDAGPQDGVNSLTVIMQTVGTAALNEDGSVKFRVDSQCRAAENGRAPSTSVPAEPCFVDQAAFDAFDAPLQQDLDENGNVTGVYKWGVYGANGFPVPVPFPFCIDYSPVDAPTQGETPYRNQCWDGFRTTKEITHEWRFYFFSFEEMRQAGWGQYADRFRTDQLKSVNILTSVFQPVNVLIDEVSFYKRRP